MAKKVKVLKPVRCSYCERLFEDEWESDYFTHMCFDTCDRCRRPKHEHVQVGEEHVCPTALFKRMEAH